MGASFKLTKRTFSNEIEAYCEKHGTSYLDAIISLCEIHEIEPDTVKGLLTPEIKEKLDVDFQKINMRPKLKMLPVKKV